MDNATASNEKPTQDTSTKEQLVTPWQVSGSVVNGTAKSIDYDKIVESFGVSKIDPTLIERLERVTGKPAHFLIRRGIFFAHRDLEKILDLFEQGKPFYLYTGRGPSNESMHLGHCIPFLFCKYLQEVFQAPLVIQMTDDEKYHFNANLSLETCKEYAYKNALDIIAFGFDPEKTFIFIDSQYYGYMFDCILNVQKCLNFNQCCSVFGFDDKTSIGKLSYPCAQIATAFPGSFPHLFGSNKSIPSFIPCAIDQDPYFRLARDIAPRLKYSKPSLIYSVFFPALQGFQCKMSSSIDSSAIFLSDSAQSIKTKIRKYAFSGGQPDIESHRALGGNPDIDVSYQYLKFLHSDDAELAALYSDYRSGKLLSGDLKARAIQILTDFVADFQKKRSAVTPDYAAKFMLLPFQRKEQELRNQIATLEQKLNQQKP